MADLEALLIEIEQLIPGEPAQAEGRLRALIATLGVEELRSWQVDLQRTIDQFYPKRQRALSGVLEARVRSLEEAPASVAGAHADLDELTGPLVDALRVLSDQHIFQWSTFYHDSLYEFFDLIVDSVAASPGTTVSDMNPVRLALGEHSHEVFHKGFVHVTRDRHGPLDFALAKSLSGLQRFLDLPIEFYSSALHSHRNALYARSLRLVTSSMLLAIVEGYAAVSFATQTGSEVLSQNARSWAHILPFLTSEHLRAATAAIAPGTLRDGVETALQPLVEAVDAVCAKNDDYAPVPVLSQGLAGGLRLDVALDPPPHTARPQPLEVQCYLDAALVQQYALEEAARRDVALVVADLRPDLSAQVQASEQLRQRVVSVKAGDAAVSRRLVLGALEFTIYVRRSARLGNEPLRYNFARGFPLQNPFLTRYFHVYRSSVRELLRAFERRNGVRLWCSVRRSGKTTACLDLGTTTGDSAVVVQTCASTGQLPGATTFYDAVVDALISARQIPRDFFVSLVETCADERSADRSRFVFILDEYETLFGRLQAASRTEEGIRYTVLQPLLDQMVAFTQENLLVFLGQQPNAHFVLMDQNQLSAYVEQDPFPLFRHHDATTSTEFSELLRKVLTDRATFDVAFANAVFAETRGHPFLTVNLLVEFVEWLIESERPIAALTLTGDDFAQFAASRLVSDRVSMTPEYAFFREAIAEATSEDGRRHAPWLHAVYACLREIARSSPTTMSCTLGDFTAFATAARVEELGLTPQMVLTSGAQANFFAFNGESVAPAIPLLGRIAAVTRPRIAP
jgi:hypothetical protein